LGFAAEMIDEMEAGIPARAVIGRKLRRGGRKLLRLIGADRTVIAHAVEHVGEALPRALRMAVRPEIARALGQPGQERAFRYAQCRGRLAEIAARRKLHSPRAAAEIDRVEIKLENLVLAQGAFDPRRHHDLADLALVRDVVADHEILGDLLGDGRAALGPARLRQIAHEGADQAALIDAMMLKKTLVLRRHEGVAHVRRNPAQPDRDSPLAACGSSIAVVINSSRLMSSMSKALRIWVQPSRSSCTISSRSRAASNSVLIASGRVVTWLSASAVAKILIRMAFIGTTWQRTAFGRFMLRLSGQSELYMT